MMQTGFRFIRVVCVALALSAAQNVFAQDTPPPDFVEFEKAPEVIKSVAPRYPELARRAGMEGTVFVRVWIDREGKVRAVEVQKSDAEIFNQPAIEAAQQMLFSPAMMKGEPVSVWVAIPFKFKLNAKPAAPDTSRTAPVSDSLRSAVEKLSEVMNMEEVVAQTMDQMLVLQLQQQPGLLPFAATLRAFFEKHMSWQNLKTDFVQLYAEAFTLKEVQDLITFYQTPTGQKAIKKMPELMTRGGQIGAQRVQENYAELVRMIEEAAATEKKN